MAFSFKELKQLKNQIAAAAGIDTATAARVIGYYNGGGPSLRPDVVRAMIGGDLSHVGPALVALGIPAAKPAADDKGSAATEPGTDNGSTAAGHDLLESVHTSGSASAGLVVPDGDNITAGTGSDMVPDGVGDDLHDGSGMAPDGFQNAPQRAETVQAVKRTPKKQNASKTDKQRLKDEKLQAKIEALLLKGPQNTLETVQADIIPDDSLPDSIQYDIEIHMQEFAEHYKLDLWKISGLQWRAVCLSIGDMIQKTGVLLDTQQCKKTGRKIYNPYKVAALLPIWENFTTLYKHVPLASDFIAFTGVSREYFYDTENRLTSGLVDIAKKARAVEESAMAAALVDPRENPTGRIFYSKCKLDYRESGMTDSGPAVMVVSLSQLKHLGINGG